MSAVRCSKCDSPDIHWCQDVDCPESAGMSRSMVQSRSESAGNGPGAVTDEHLAEIAAALVAIGKACLVVAPTLRRPYSDDLSQNPWDKFVHEPAKRAYNLGHELRRELRSRGVEVPR